MTDHDERVERFNKLFNADSMTEREERDEIRRLLRESGVDLSEEVQQAIQAVEQGRSLSSAEARKWLEHERSKQNKKEGPSGERTLGP